MGDPSITTIFQMDWAYIEISSISVTLTKISILLFYERIFARSWMTRGCMVLCAMYLSASTVLFLVGCRPISWFWDRVTDLEGTGKCIDTQQFYFWTGVCDTVLDTLVLLIPIQNGMSNLYSCFPCGTIIRPQVHACTPGPRVAKTGQRLVANDLPLQ